MKKEIERLFEDYLLEFEKQESVCEKFKKLTLEQIGLGSELEPYVKKFLDTAQRCAYPYATALGYAMMFFITYSRDLDQAIIYNNKARELFLGIPDYQEREGILTVANNAVLANILKENYGAAYTEILEAMPMAEKGKRISYYSAFLNNGAIILSEFGLYKKAIQQVEETLQKRDIIGDSNFFVTVFLLSNLYLNARETNKLRNLLDQYLPEMKKSEYYDPTIYDKQYMEAAMIEGDSKQAEAIYRKLIESYDYTKNDNLDNSEVDLSLARYHMYVKDYDHAQVYYEKLLEHSDDLLGHKRQVLEEIAHLYELRHEFEKAYHYLKEAHERTLTYISFIDDMYRKEIDDVWERNRMLSYEVLYDRLLDITGVGKEVISSLNRRQLYDTLKQRSGNLFSFDNFWLLLWQESEQLFTDTEGVKHSIEDIPLLKECLMQTSLLSYGNLEKSLQDQLQHLWKKQTRSLLLQPVTYQGNLLAVFLMESSQIEAFSKTDQSLLQIFSDYVAIALHNTCQMEAAMEKSSYDYLTSTYNRSALMMYGEEMLHTALQDKLSIGVLMADIDDFKIVNDTYGHMMGDEVIRQVTNIMNKEKQHGILARFGGEEFILLIDDIQKQELYEIAEHIRYKCENCCIPSEDGGKITFTISIGCCYREPAKGSLQELFHEADQRMYVAKRNGKNCVQM